MNVGKIFVFAAVFLMAVSLAFAAPGGASTTEGASEQATGTSSTTVDTEGGNVTYVDVSGTSITGRWAGFFGNISGNIMLGDSSDNQFFQWTVSDLTGAVVYAANTTVTDWTQANFDPASNAVMPSYVQGSLTDNFTNTFTASEEFSSSSLTVADVPFATTWNSTGVGNLKTYALQSIADNALVFGGLAVDDTDGFNGNSVDYQILVPAETTTSYSFYLELP
ncbi:MAG: hypothetical protein ACQESE_00395 [Nanobdellota archaeon]